MRRFAGAFLVLLSVAGCASQPTETADGSQVYDPIEPVNRLIFAMNETVDTFVLQPTAFVYKTAMPDPMEEMVHNFLRWLRSPVVIVNSLLQGDTENAEDATRQLFVNAVTVGLIDWGEGFGWGYREEDFGQTLAVHGVDGGPYLVLPLLGPSNGRDAVGKVVDIFFDPLTYVINGSDTRTAVALGRGAAEAVDFRARNFETINNLKESSVDYYARLRSVYLQRREVEIKNGKVPENAVASDGSKEFDEFVPSDRPRSVTGELPTTSN